MGIIVTYTQKSKSHKELYHLGAKAWNILPQSLRASQSVTSFSSICKNAPIEKLKNDEHNIKQSRSIYLSTNPYIKKSLLHA